jgi:hypothetical protein
MVSPYKRSAERASAPSPAAPQQLSNIPWQNHKNYHPHIYTSSKLTMEANNNELIQLSILKLGSRTGILSGIAADGLLRSPITQSKQTVIDSLFSVLTALFEVAKQLDLDPATTSSIQAKRCSIGTL